MSSQPRQESREERSRPYCVLIMMTMMMMLMVMVMLIMMKDERRREQLNTSSSTETLGGETAGETSDEATKAGK